MYSSWVSLNVNTKIYFIKERSVRSTSLANVQRNPSLKLDDLRTRTSCNTVLLQLLELS